MAFILLCQPGNSLLYEVGRKEDEGDGGEASSSKGSLCLLSAPLPSFLPFFLPLSCLRQAGKKKNIMKREKEREEGRGWQQKEKKAAPKKGEEEGKGDD